MKTIWETLTSVKDVYSEKFPQGLIILLVLFFITFGAVSLFLLMNSPA